MNRREFFEEVARMREYQRNYYSTRKADPEAAKQWLSASLKQEKLIDDEIARVRQILAQSGSE